MGNYLYPSIDGPSQRCSDVIITSLTIVYSSVYSGADQRKHQSSASLAFVREIHWRPVIYPHKGPVTRKMFPFDAVIMAPAFVITTVSADDLVPSSASPSPDNVLVVKLLMFSRKFI